MWLLYDHFDLIIRRGSWLISVLIDNRMMWLFYVNLYDFNMIEFDLIIQWDSWLISALFDNAMFWLFLVDFYELAFVSLIWLYIHWDNIQWSPTNKVYANLWVVCWGTDDSICFWLWLKLLDQFFMILKEKYCISVSAVLQDMSLIFSVRWKVSLKNITRKVVFVYFLVLAKYRKAHYTFSILLI